MVTGALGGGLGKGVVAMGVTGAGVTGSGVTGFGRGVSGSGLGLGFGVVSGSGFGLGLGVVSGFGFGVASGSGVADGLGLGLGLGEESGAGVIGTVCISSRALRNCRFFSSSLVSARKAAACRIQRASNDRKMGRTRRMLAAASAHSSGAREKCAQLAKPLGIKAARPYLARMKPFLIRWFCTTIAVAVAVKLTGMQAEGVGALIGTALFLGIINAFIRPVLLLLSLPFILVTLGFFILVVNALMLWFAGGIVPGFHVGGFWNAFFGSIIVSIVSWALSAVFKDSDGKYQILTHHGQIKQVQGKVIE